MQGRDRPATIRSDTDRVNDPSRRPVGVFVIRLWSEADGVRGRVTSRLDVADDRDDVTYVSSAVELHECLQGWVSCFAPGDPRFSGSGPGPDPHAAPDPEPH